MSAAPTTAELVLELRAEEIPAGYLAPAAAALREAVEKSLRESGVAAPDLQTAHTPRRIVLRAPAVPLASPRAVELRTGPPWRAAFDAEGRPTKAAQGFAAGQGVAVEALEKVATPKGEYVGARVATGGEPTVGLLARALPQAIARLPWPKSMRWGDHDFRFARPLHGVVALLGGEVVPFVVGPASSGRSTVGHRLAPTPFEVSSYAELRDGLRERFVVLDPEERRARIREGVARLAHEAGGEPWSDEGLVDTVANLCEWPVPVLGAFDEKYLVLPGDFLATIMIHHQKFFPVRAEGDGLRPRFVGISNLPSDDQSAVRAGFEWVLRARLEDGLFFWNEDARERLEARVEALGRVVFFHGAGTMLDKTHRVTAVATWLAGLHFPWATETAHRASRLCKADLTTQMVGEFPELQGRVGQVYAARDGEGEAVAEAVFEHYLPRGADDRLPETDAGFCVALADKVDTLAACFARGQQPTGSADPYGLRRAALGVLRTVLARGPRLSLSALVDEAIRGLEGTVEVTEPGAPAALREFLRVRLRVLLIQDEAFDTDLVDAVMEAGWDDPVDVRRRLEALAALRREGVLAGLITPFKRASHISKKEADEGLDEASLRHPAERELLAAYRAVERTVVGALAAGDYEAAIAGMRDLRGPVDRFFDAVMVMDPDPEVRRHRLGLMHAIARAFARLADFSLVTTE
ncbi:glycine--tRNA ligase subunit beta [Myxococcota bacterium]|nr:glycine--tRNA ligase subunit beta [Myxococcota bacterium]